MEALYVLIPLGVLVALVAGAVFLLAANDGQFDELEQPARDILSDGPAQPPA